MNKTITINFYLGLDIGNGNGSFESKETGRISPWNIGLDSKSTTRQTIVEYCKQNSYTFKISNIKSRSLYGKEAQLKLEKIK